MRRRTSLLLATAVTAAFAGGLTSRAMAFEIVDWEWQKLIDEDWDIDVRIRVEYSPTGIVEIEKLQMHFGDVEAEAHVFAINNDPPLETEGLEPFEVIANIDGSLTYQPSGGGSVNPIDAGQDLSSDNPDVDVQNITGNVDEANDDDGANVDLNFDVVVQVDPGDVPTGAISWEALPEVRNIATGVMNNQDIYSTSALMLHDAQIAAGDINPLVEDDDEEQNGEVEPDALAFLIGAYLLTEVDDELEGINEHTDLALLTLLGAMTGFFDPAEVDAEATAFWITNATVENKATAVGNNLSAEISTDVQANALMVADFTQLLIGDVDADATTGFVEINNYDLAGLDRPIVENVATAVGNNLVIKVDACGGCVTPPGR